MVFLKKVNFILLLILLIGGFFRFYNLNWDQGFHLHPDERFLAMVGNAMKVPQPISGYFDPNVSTLNPANIGYKFFVYGTFPIILNKILAVVIRTDSYNDFTLQGRFLSTLFELIIIFFIYKTVKLFEYKYKLHHSIKYIAGFFYAIAVLPIQLSHFFTVDTFLNFFLFASFYFILRFYLKNSLLDFILSGIFLSLAFASKISAVFILPLITIFLIKSLSEKKASVKLLLLVFYSLVFYLFLRISNSYLFETNNFLNLQINHNFLESLKALKYLEGKDVWFPPSVQWLGKPPIIFSLINLVLFGIGIPYFIFIILGFYFTIKYKKIDLIIIFFWIITFFLYQSTQFVKTMRYFIFIYPFLAIFAAFGLQHFTNHWKRQYKALVFLALLIWPLLFFSIYTKKHTRIEASEWIYKNFENGSIILGEHWDDPLPLAVQNNFQKQFVVELLPVFDPDTPEKWKKMNSLLEKANYYILSSNRAWGSIPTVPEKYPRMGKFYKDLFADKLSYKKIKEFTSYPSLRYLGIPIDFPDDWAEEAFTVYDHPKVVIFKK